MNLSNYWKLWGALAGSIIGLLVAYNLVPQSTGDQLTQLLNLAIPVIGGAIATYFFPKNTNTNS